MHSFQTFQGNAVINAGQELQQEPGSRGGGVLCSWGEPGFG